LLGIATIWGITSANFGIQGKFEPWLWDNIQELEANGTPRIISLTIQLTENTETLKNYTARLLVENHGAEDIWIASTFPTIIAKVNSTEVKTIAAYDFVKLLGDGQNPKYSFGLIRATLRNPVWDWSRGTVDFLLCNEGSMPLKIVSITVNENEAEMYPSNVSLLSRESVNITIYYRFELGRTYTFILTDSTRTRHGPYDFIVR